MPRFVRSLAAIWGSFGCCAAVFADPAPNVVIIFTDDQGYADVGCFGAEGFETPNLDRMAAEGRKFTSFYVAQAVCGASRAALLTGCYPNRIGMLGAPSHSAKHGINPDASQPAHVSRRVNAALGYQQSILRHKRSQ